MVGKGKNKKVNNAGGATEKYDDSFVDRLMVFKDYPAAITTKGILSPSKIGKHLFVSRETIRRWANVVPGNEDNFKPKFAAAFKKLQDLVDTGNIKRSMIEKAIGYPLIKIVRAPDEKTGKQRIIRKETTFMPGSEAAAKMVLNNIGDKDWDFTEKSKSEVNIDGLGQLLAEINGSGKKLPNDDREDFSSQINGQELEA